MPSSTLRVDLDAMTAAFVPSKTDKLGSTVQIIVYGVELTVQVTVELCSMDDDDVMRLVESSKRLSVCSRKSGWFGKASSKTSGSFFERN